jgi:hypothetical protein
LSTPTTTDPPYVPIRRSGWPVRRTPLWILLALVLLAGAGVLVSLSHRPSNAQQTTDLNGYLKDMNAAIESCAGGVSESQQALTAIEAGSKDNLSTAVRLVNYNANNCEPANTQPLADLTQYQVTESLQPGELYHRLRDLGLRCGARADGHDHRDDRPQRGRSHHRQRRPPARSAQAQRGPGDDLLHPGSRRARALR